MIHPVPALRFYSPMRACDIAVPNLPGAVEVLPTTGPSGLLPQAAAIMVESQRFSSRMATDRNPIITLGVVPCPEMYHMSQVACAANGTESSDGHVLDTRREGLRRDHRPDEEERHRSFPAHGYVQHGAGIREHGALLSNSARYSIRIRRKSRYSTVPYLSTADTVMLQNLRRSHCYSASAGRQLGLAAVRLQERPAGLDPANCVALHEGRREQSRIEAHPLGRGF